MAVNATAVYRVRAGGSNVNGGGYDPGIAGAATDYSQQDAAQASASLGTSTASTTFTDVGALFTSAMVGNALWLASGTGTTVGAYFITGFTNSSTITLDRASGTYTAGVWKIGGAWADPRTNITGTPAYIVPGNLISIRAGGSGSVASPDYTVSSFMTVPNGNGTAGLIKFVGENGRPFIKAASGSGLIFFTAGFNGFDNLYLVGNGTGNGDLGLISGSNSKPLTVNNVVMDQNGSDIVGIQLTGTITNSEILSSTANSGSAGTKNGIITLTYGAQIEGCNIHDCWGIGILLSSMASLRNSIVAKSKGDNIQITEATDGFCGGISNCTIDGAAPGGTAATTPNGITFLNARAFSHYSVVGCIISNHATNGIKTSAGTTAVNDLARAYINTNAYFNNGVNALNFTVGTSIVNGTTLNDVIGTDPQYAALSTEDYSLGANLKALGFPPAAFRQNTSGNTATVRSYMDMGGVQRQEPAAGGGFVNITQNRYIDRRDRYAS